MTDYNKFNKENKRKEVVVRTADFVKFTVRVLTLSLL